MFFLPTPFLYACQGTEAIKLVLDFSTPGLQNDPIMNARNVKKTQRWVISEEAVVLMGLLLGYQGD